VLDDLRVATGQRQIARALQQAGSLRSLYRSAGARTALAQFDQELRPVLDDLRVANGQRQIARALQQAGSLRSLYRSAGARTALAQFDQELRPVLDDLPVRLPDKVRTRFGLPKGASAS
jgi:muconolactone delta-isomerase